MPTTVHRPIACIVLAAGNGTRMRSPERHKVTLPICGSPVIRRVVETYHSCGVQRTVMVIGALADQVRAALAGLPVDVTYSTQAEQRGTGHAARVGANVLRGEGFDGDVLIVAGDKAIEPPVITALILAFRREHADLALAVCRTEDSPTGGRIVTDQQGRPSRVVEVADITRAHLLNALIARAPMSATIAHNMATEAFHTEATAAIALGPLSARVRAGETIRPEDVPTADVTAMEAESAQWVNVSVYLFRASALYEALDALSSDNAQGEEYLTDAIQILADRGGVVTAVPVGNPSEAMGFNTPEEYAVVRRVCEAASARRISRRLQSTGLPSAAQSAQEAFAARYGDRNVLVARAPGRLNLMGRHVDHQGGTSNLIAIDRSAWLVVAKRDDRRVRIHNADPRFPDGEYDFDELGVGTHDSWPTTVNSAAVRDVAFQHRGDWSLYIRAACARLEAFAGRPLAGMDIAAAGDIPIAAGLSSSSALVVAAAEAIAVLNGLTVTRERLVELCSEAEWYVGTRGGAGDHAAMILGREGYVTQVGYFPFRVLGAAPMPTGYTFSVFHSGIPARKTAEAKHTFNQRVACYHIGREMLKRVLPEHATRIEHLRDVSAENLGLSAPELFSALKALPEAMTAREAATLLSAEDQETYLDLEAHPDDMIPVRSVVVFGLAECERSSKSMYLLRAGDMVAFGRWMTLSHNGDRVAPGCTSYADADMDGWLSAAEAGDRGSALELQPGAYGCSLPQLDAMVDIALSVPGVMGAQLSGAGLGGCIMALVENSAIEALDQAMTRRYYEPEAITRHIIRCQAVDGSGIQ